MDSEGYVTITGRLKDIIIRGGENIHPLDIENCLIAHEAIADAAVCGVPDEKYGEVVAVFIVRRGGGLEITEDEVRSWVREKLSGHFGTSTLRLAHHNSGNEGVPRSWRGSPVPKYVFCIEDFPKTPSGKVQRFKLKERAMETLKKRATETPLREGAEDSVSCGISRRPII